MTTIITTSGASAVNTADTTTNIYALELRDLCKSFGKTEIIRNAQLAVHRGERVAMIGPNGAGKSTLFNLISGRFAPSSGQVLLHGKRIEGKKPFEINRMGLSRSFQITNIFPKLSVFENLLVAASFAAGLNARAAQAHCVEILEQTGLSNRADTPAGSLRLLDRKRLELARALAARPRLLLLDEIAGGLTDAECGELLKIIGQVHASGVAVIWIEHVLHVLVSFAPRLLVLDFGAKLADGPTGEVMGNADVQRIYMGIQT